jgi:hypothetical protein
MTNNHLPITDIIKRLERRKMTCDWADVDAIQKKISYYQGKLDNGAEYEIAF